MAPFTEKYSNIEYRLDSKMTGLFRPYIFNVFLNAVPGRLLNYKKALLDIDSKLNEYIEFKDDLDYDQRVKMLEELKVDPELIRILFDVGKYIG
jgi:hypothetical protein